MRAIWIKKYGKPSVLEVRETPDPEPRENEVRIRVHACGLNFSEVMARQGLYPDAPRPPMVVGYEAAGVVDAVGTNARAPAVGTRVIVLSKFGAHADTVCVPVAQTLEMPDSMTFEEGAALPVNYVTAYHMLFEIARIRPGAKILVHMAAGGVGTAVLQLCRTVENIVTFGTASEAKHEYVRSHGCMYPIDYKSTDYADEIRRLTNNELLDLVLDPRGGPDWSKGYSLLRSTGMLIAFGFANVNRGGRRRIVHVLGQLARVPKFSPMQLMSDNRCVAGVNMGHMWKHMDMMRRELAALIDLYTKGIVRPHIDKVFRFEDAADAHRHLEEGHNVGKIVLKP